MNHCHSQSPPQVPPTISHPRLVNFRSKLWFFEEALRLYHAHLQPVGINHIYDLELPIAMSAVCSTQLFTLTEDESGALGIRIRKRLLKVPFKQGRPYPSAEGSAASSWNSPFTASPPFPVDPLG